MQNRRLAVLLSHLKYAEVTQPQIRNFSTSATVDAKHRNAYKYFCPIQTRWMDNDQYGHVNNTVYYSYFDSVVNKYLIDHCDLDPSSKQSAIGLVAETKCNFYSSITFPDTIDAGLCVKKLGKSSVVYQIGIFNNDTCAAVGHFVHVYVDPITRRPVDIPTKMREQLLPLCE